MLTDLVRCVAGRTVLVASLLAAATHARAQSTTPFTPGARVRVAIRDAYPARSTGRLVAIGGDTMRYIPDGDSASRVVLLDRVTRLDASRGVHRHPLQGFVTGAAIGVFTGVIVGYASGDDPTQEFLSFSRGDKAVILGTAFSVIGGGIGTLIGLATRTEVWQPVARPYALTFAPQRDGVRIGLHFVLPASRRERPDSA